MQDGFEKAFNKIANPEAIVKMAASRTITYLLTELGLNFIGIPVIGGIIVDQISNQVEPYLGKRSLRPAHHYELVGSAVVQGKTYTDFAGFISFGWTKTPFMGFHTLLYDLAGNRIYDGFINKADTGTYHGRAKSNRSVVVRVDRGGEELKGAFWVPGKDIALRFESTSCSTV